MPLKTMKNSKVIGNNLAFLLMFFFCCPLQAFTNPVSFCSQELISLECIDQDHTTIDPDNDRIYRLFSFEGKFIYLGNEYSFSTRRPSIMESCFELMEKIKLITSTEQFCVQTEDRFEDDFYVTLEGFFSSKGAWTYFEDYEKFYYRDYTEPICECLNLEDEEVDSYIFLNPFRGFDFFKT